MPLVTSSDAAARITSHLLQAEEALNEALQREAVLLSSMLAAREEYGEPLLGQEAVMRLVKSQQSLLAAGSDLARVHHSLLKIGREKGAVIHDCPENKPMRPTTQELRNRAGPGPDAPETFLQNVVAFG